MYEKFGEFNSVEELNMAAEGLLKEKDIKSLMELAKENGIDKEDAEDYIDGCTPELATVTMAAFGKLKIEEEEEITGQQNQMERAALTVIITMLKGMCTDEAMAAAVMHKGKRVSEIFKEMKSEASSHKSGNVAMACGTDRELCEIIKAYYLESDEGFESAVKKAF